MNERERIIELVKNGVLSTEEGLDLIEGIANKETKERMNKEFSSMEEEKAESIEEDIESLASDMTAQSARLDEVNSEIIEREATLEELEARLQTLTDEYDDGTIDTLDAEITDLKEQKRLIEEMDEIDSTNEVAQINLKIDEKMRAIDAKEESLAGLNDEIEDLTVQITELSLELDNLMDERDALEKEVNGTQSERFASKIQELKSQLKFSDDWKKDASETMDKAGKQVSNAGREVNRLVKDLVDSSKSFIHNFEWKKQEFKVPTLTSKEFTKKWTINEFDPTILDIKNANGDLIIETADVEDIDIEVEATIFGRLDTSIEEAFEQRTTFKVDSDRLKLHIPNKRIKASIKMILPKRKLDFITINVLNGDINVSDVTLTDLSANLTNGNIKLNGTKGSLVELKGTNSSFEVTNATIKDFLAGTVSGTVAVQGDVISSSINTTNGEVKASLTSPEMALFEANTVNGNIKVAVPSTRDLEAEAHTTFGKVYSRLSNIEEDIVGKNQNEITYRRENEGNAIRVKAKTTNGKVLFKDSI